MPTISTGLTWVVLTMGNRPEALERSLQSLISRGAKATEVIVVVNDPAATVVVPMGVRLERQKSNLGVPGGRDVGARLATTELVGFLDDDAELLHPMQRIATHFEKNARCGAVSLRLVDESGATARRHVPRRGKSEEARSGPVATFLGGASVVRSSAYREVDGYFNDLRYGHEELELSWRMINAGWQIDYLADVTVFHPRTEISRHVDGWWMTGRNRVLIARRTLPRPVSWIHALSWLLLGVYRAPGFAAKRAYGTAWLLAWRLPVARSPIRWATVARLGRLGRLPVV